MTGLAAMMAGNVARFAERPAAWTVFGFETAKDKRFARIQRRYPWPLHASATGPRRSTHGR